MDERGIVWEFLKHGHEIKNNWADQRYDGNQVK
jgi:hypothetical protein